MTSNSSNFEWHIGEDQWGGFSSSSIATAQLNQALLSINERRLIFGVLRGLLFCGLALIFTAAHFKSQPEQLLEQRQVAIAASLNAEKNAWQLNNRALLEKTMDPNLVETWGPSWRKYWRGSTDERQNLALEILHVESQQLSGNPLVINSRFTRNDGSTVQPSSEGSQAKEYLFVDILDRQPPRDWWLISPTRETRVYTQYNESHLNDSKASGGWIRTIPPASFWGEAQSNETANIRYEYYERDADIIHGLATRIEEQYQQLMHILEIEPLDAQIKFTVRLAPDPRQGRGSRSTVVYITSPLLATKPAGLTDAAYVERFVVRQLTSLSVNRAAGWRGSSDNLQWSTVMWALRSQLETHLIGEPSPWFAQNESIFADYGEERHPMALEEITRIRRAKTDPDRRHVFWQQIGAELLVGYAIEQYGIESIAKIIPAFNRSRNWEHFIPNVFGITQEEFEADFNQYVAQRYGWAEDE